MAEEPWLTFGTSHGHQNRHFVSKRRSQEINIKKRSFRLIFWYIPILYMIKNMLITSNWAEDKGLAMDGSAKHSQYERKMTAKTVSEPRDGRANRDEFASRVSSAIFVVVVARGACSFYGHSPLRPRSSRSSSHAHSISDPRHCQPS